MNRLLILACSGSKTPGKDPIPARERYNGPLWQTLRKVDPDTSKAHHAYVSAKYGFGNADYEISNYNTRMTRFVADALIATGVTSYYPRAKKGLQGGMTPCATVASWTKYGRDPFGDVAICGGGLYIEVMEGLVAGFLAEGLIAKEARIVTINDQIGYMRQQLATWLNESATIRNVAV